MFLNNIYNQCIETIFSKIIYKKIGKVKKYRKSRPNSAFYFRMEFSFLPSSYTFSKVHTQTKFHRRYFGLKFSFFFFFVKYAIIVENSIKTQTC